MRLKVLTQDCKKQKERNIYRSLRKVLTDFTESLILYRRRFLFLFLNDHNLVFFLTQINFRLIEFVCNFHDTWRTWFFYIKNINLYLIL